MAFLLPFLRTWWKLIIIVMIIAAGVMWYKHLTNTIEDQREQIASLTTENTVIKENNAKLEASIQANNTAISKLAEGAADTKRNFAALGSTVRSQSDSLEQRLRGILVERKPQTCEETIQYLIDAAKEYK